MSSASIPQHLGADGADRLAIVTHGSQTPGRFQPGAAQILQRLTRYLIRLFSAEALGLFAVAAALLYLTQCLILFDIVAGKGQSIWTLLGQASLAMPGLSMVFLYVCLGIGLGRALRTMQGTSELQMIHTNRLIGALLRAIGVYALGGALVVLVLSHTLDPLGQRATSQWSTSIAADLVSRSMIPHKFTEISKGVSVVIGSRDGAGNISDFFADDRRDPEKRRSYISKTAIITRDEKGYVLRMHDGAIQTLSASGQFTEISFARYDLPLDNLTEVSPSKDVIGQSTSIEMLLRGMHGRDVDNALLKRSAEGLRVIGLCVFVAAIATFPTGKRRRFEVPIELTILGVAFVERAVTSYLHGPGILSVASGSVLLIVIGLIVLALRLRVFRPVRMRRQTA